MWGSRDRADTECGGTCQWGACFLGQRVLMGVMGNVAKIMLGLAHQDQSISIL